jgi:hypothetical protein
MTIAICLLDETFDFATWVSRLHPLVKGPAFAAAVLVSYAFSQEGNQPFIYFRF